MMSRKKRAAIAAETVEICDAGFYTAEPDEQRIRIRTEIAAAVSGTVTYDLSTLGARPAPRFDSPAKLELTGESTFEAIDRLSETGGHVGCLNFASAKNPGGGFLGGSQAQEEALARSSALYPCLQTQFDHYYQPNRWNDSSLYLDLAIFSPLVPFFRDDAANLLDQPLLVSVITAPAPNAGAVLRNEPNEESRILPTLERRAEMVLRAAAIHEIDTLILGAWGCGVFRNDPKDVARVFADLVGRDGEYAEAFKQVTFAVYDPDRSKGNLDAFESVFSPLLV